MMETDAERWQPIETAPKDGTLIRGRNANGEEATIHSKQTHSAVPDMRHWAVGAETKEGHWLVSKCFYPVEWMPLTPTKDTPNDR
jgi:hypothetical protein